MPLSTSTRVYRDQTKVAKVRAEIVSRLLMLSVLANEEEDALLQSLVCIFARNTLRIRGDRLIVVTDHAEILMRDWDKWEAEQMLTQWIMCRLELPYNVRLELAPKASASGAT